LSEQLVGLVNFLGELIKVGHVILDFFDGEIDKHTSDLGCAFLTNLLEDKVIDGVTDLFLVLRVHLLDGRHNSGGVSKEGLNLLLVGHNFGGHLLLRNRRHLLLLLHLSHRLGHHRLRLVWHHLLLGGGRHVVREILLHHVTLVHSLLVRVLLTTASTLVALVTTLVVTHVLSGQELEHVLKERHEVGSGGDLVKEVGATVLSSMLLEVSLIFGLFKRDFAELLDFVVINVKRSFTEGLVMKTLFSNRCLIRSLEANKSVDILTLVVSEHLEAFNITKLLESLSKLLLGGLRREVFDVQVASLFGVLVLEHLTSSLDSSALLLESFLDVELVTLNFAVVELLDSLGSSFRSIFTVLLVFRVVANESVGTLIVAAKLEALNATVSTKELFKLRFFVVLRQVLHIDVVIDAAEVTLVLGLVLDTNVRIFVCSIIKGLLGAIRGLEAYESVLTRGVVSIKRDL